MRNILTVVIILAGILFVPLNASAEDIKATFSIGSQTYTMGEGLHVMDGEPFIQDGRTFIPIRYLALALEVPEENIKWISKSQKVVLKKDEKKITLTVGEKTMEVNNESSSMDVAPIVKNGRTYLPARWLAEALGYKVQWQESNGNITISLIDTIQRMHINGIYWNDDTSIPSWVTAEMDNVPYCIVTTEEWFEEDNYEQLDNFISKAGKIFYLKPGCVAPAVKASLIRTFSKGDGSFQGLILELDTNTAFVSGVDYTILPDNPSNEYKWSARSGVKLIKPLENTSGEFKGLHVNGVYWHGDNRIPSWINRFPCDFLISFEEPITTNINLDALRRFMYKAGGDFVLRKEGYPDIAVSASGSCNDENNFQAAIVDLEPEEKIKMVSGISYTLYPVNTNSEYKWIVRSGITVKLP